MDTTFVYYLALFLHILGAFGLIAALTFEAIGLRGLRRAVRREDALIWLGLSRVVQRLAPTSLGLILVTGLYMMVTSWGARAWILVALASLVAFGAVGGLLTGVRMARIGPAVGRASGPLSDELRGALRDPILLTSFRIRLSIVIGIAFLMSVKPSVVASLAVVVLGAAIGLFASVVTAGRNGFRTEAHGAALENGERGRAS
ncbi:MAG TPA: hypothetical protein VGR77_07175 [Candidatus Dormibacteraeota bacterium]|nr:hypothetical protein [Candidatus Dormibacteraeota bacterium]